MFQRSLNFICKLAKIHKYMSSVSHIYEIQLDWENRRKSAVKEARQRRVRNRKFDYLDLFRYELVLMCCLLAHHTAFLTFCFGVFVSVRRCIRCQYKAFPSHPKVFMKINLSHNKNNIARAAGWARKKPSLLCSNLS